MTTARTYEEEINLLADEWEDHTSYSKMERVMAHRFGAEGYHIAEEVQVIIDKRLDRRKNKEIFG